MDMRERIKKDFDVDLPISGGFTKNSRNNPIIIDTTAGKDYRRVEDLYLDCICMGRRVEKEFLGRESIKHNDRNIDWVIIKTTETTPTEIITQEEGYYFDVTECVNAGEKKTYRDFRELWREIEARDTVFRRHFDQVQLGLKPRFSYAPFSGDGIFEGRDAVWQKLFAGQVSEEDALDSLTDLMEKYYSAPYALGRAWR
jgi:hypothetical protein